MADIEQIAQSFVQHYYNLFDTNRAGLANLYQESSMMTWERDRMMGVNQIMSKLMSMTFQSCKHQIVTADVQPLPNNGILVFVVGQLAVDEESNPMMFTQVFGLVPHGAPGNYYLHNDMFRFAHAI